MTTFSSQEDFWTAHCAKLEESGYVCLNEWHSKLPNIHHFWDKMCLKPQNQIVEKVTWYGSKTHMKTKGLIKFGQYGQGPIGLAHGALSFCLIDSFGGHSTVH